MVVLQPAARRLDLRARGKAAFLGITDDQGWVPLLRLSSPSAHCNVMSLDVRHHSRWSPTFHRGTPRLLAETLTGELHFLWRDWVNDLRPSGISDHGH
jgi:hypothetical protein